MGAFSSKTSSPAPAAGEISQIDRAMLDLKNARDRLQRYRNKLEQDDTKLVAQAKKAKNAGQKEKALGILRLRKYKKAQAASCEDQLLNVLQMVGTIDSKQNEQQVLSALAAGKDTLKMMHEETTVDDVLDLMDAIKDEIEVEQEITQILQNVPELSPADEEAVEAELAALQAEMDAEKLPDDLPTAPTDELPELKISTPAKVPSTAVQPTERVAVPG
mmetsp:Transcript_1677/g.2410  ORF Transcript_1677/g.2410 Transcript_1677/m.2410 type:complete len:218 (+) Transcript_1677:223-876(+)